MNQNTHCVWQPVEAPLGFTLQCDGYGIALSTMGGCADRTNALTLLLEACACVPAPLTRSKAGLLL